MDGPRLVNLLQISCCNFSVFTALKIDSLQKNPEYSIFKTSLPSLKSFTAMRPHGVIWFIL